MSDNKIPNSALLSNLFETEEGLLILNLRKLPEWYQEVFYKMVDARVEMQKQEEKAGRK